MEKLEGRSARALTRSIDAIDVRILEVLLSRGRITNRALAKCVELSESACSARLTQLKDAGIIVGYSATIALDRLGILRVWADVVLADDKPATIGRFEALLLGEPEILTADMIGGSAHVRLLAATAGFERWEALYARLLGHSDLIKRIESSPVFRSCPTRSHLSASLLRVSPAGGLAQRE